MRTSNRIAFVIGGLRIGGAEKVCISLANKFHEEGYDISLIVLNLKNAELLKYLNPDVPIIDLNLSHARMAFFPLYRNLNKFNITKCLSFNFQLSVLLVLIKKVFNIQISIYSRGISTYSEKILKEQNLRHKYFNSFLIRLLYRKSDFFIAQSTGMLKDMIEYLNVPKDKVRVIFNPVQSLQTTAEIRINEEVQTREILFVGTLKEAKNVSFLLRSIYELLRTREDFKFRIIGDGNLRSFLEQECRELGMENYVLFEGRRVNPERFYLNADVFILGSWYEGFPNVLLEALSYGVPVVSIDCKSGPEDIIIEGSNGYLVKDYDEKDFAEKICLALNREWNKEAIQASISKFNFEEIFREYREYINHESKN